MAEYSDRADHHRQCGVSVGRLHLHGQHRVRGQGQRGESPTVAILPGGAQWRQDQVLERGRDLGAERIDRHGRVNPVIGKVSVFPFSFPPSSRGKQANLLVKAQRVLELALPGPHLDGFRLDSVFEKAVQPLTRLRLRRCSTTFLRPTTLRNDPVSSANGLRREVARSPDGELPGR